MQQALPLQRLHELPDSVLIHILSYTALPDQAALACTCVRFYQLVHHEKQTSASVIDRCFPRKDASSANAECVKDALFGDILRVASSPTIRLVSDCITLKTVVDSHTFRAVYQPCGPSERLTAYLYGSLRADPASGLPFPLEGRHWVNYPWLCWPDQQGPGPVPGVPGDSKRYRSPAHACASATGDATAASPSPPTSSPATTSTQDDSAAAADPPPTSRSSPREIAAAGAYSPATMLHPLICQMTPQGLFLRFQMPPSHSRAPLEQPWHFTVEALPASPPGSQEPDALQPDASQPIHVMTQPLCLLPTSSFQRMMHEFRTGLSIHKTASPGEGEKVFVDFFMHYQHLHACMQPPDHLNAAGITRTWAGARYMHHSSRAPRPSPPAPPSAAPTPPAPSAASPSRSEGSEATGSISQDSAAQRSAPGGDTRRGGGKPGIGRGHAPEDLFFVDNSAFEDLSAVASGAHSTAAPADTPAEGLALHEGGQGAEAGTGGAAHADECAAGGSAAGAAGVEAQHACAGTAPVARHGQGSRAADAATLETDEGNACERGAADTTQERCRKAAGSCGETRGHSAQQAQHDVAGQEGGTQGAAGAAESAECTARCSMGLEGQWLPPRDETGGQAPRLTTETEWREAESTAQHASREQRMAKLSAMSGAHQSRAMAAYLRQQMWLGCYLEPPMIGGDVFVALTLYQLPIRDGEAAVGDIVAAPTLVGAMLMAEGGSGFDLVRGSSWMGEISVAGLIERGRLQAAAPSPLSAKAQAAPREALAAAGGAAGQWVNLREWWEVVVETFAGSLDSVAADVVLAHRSGRTILGRVAGELWLVSESDDLSYAEMSVPFIFDDQVVYGAIHLGELPRFNIRPRLNSLTLLLGTYNIDRLQL